MIKHGRFSTLADWLEKIPTPLLYSQPALLSLKGAVMLMGVIRRMLFTTWIWQFRVTAKKEIARDWLDPWSAGQPGTSFAGNTRLRWPTAKKPYPWLRRRRCSKTYWQKVYVCGG